MRDGERALSTDGGIAQAMPPLFLQLTARLLKCLIKRPELMLQKIPYLSGLGVAVMLFALPLQAAEVTLLLAPVWWQYEESSGQVPGFAATPLNSSANGYGLRAAVSVAQEWVDRWPAQLTLDLQQPFSESNESWNTAMGRQQNRLDVYQFESRFDQRYRLGSVEAGVWFSYLWHQQKRRSFIVNGTPIIVPSEPVVETVQSYWAGLGLKKLFPWHGLSMSFDVALPLSVRTTNSMVADVFSRNRGLRGGAGMEWSMFSIGNEIECSGSVEYRYRELGNDLKAASLWPKNRWQRVSLGADLAW